MSSSSTWAFTNFYPRPPRGGRPVVVLQHVGFHQFLSTPSARRATCCRPPARGLSPISIHALREEGDPQDHDHNQRGRHFYPRPPRGGRQACIFTRTITSLFLSTPSARRATFYRPGRYLPGMISIHALREEGDSVLSLNFDFFDISIHALREEGDPSSAVRFWLQKVFLSTPSARRATPDSRRAERGLAHFYPRPPRGGRPVMQDGLTRYVKFLSTPSARRATPRGKQATESTAISIHALREEGDVMQSFTKKYCFQFLSTPSARRATFKPEQSSVLQGLFLSTPSARRATGGSYLFLG